MKMKTQLSLFLICFSGLIGFNSCSPDNDGEAFPAIPPPVIKPNLVFIGLTASNQLVTLNANAPGTVIGTVTISGLVTNERILAIDFRPATGQLYGVSSNGGIHIINPITGATKSIGGALVPALSGPIVGFDFNPTVDRIRIVTYQGQNLRVNPETGAVVAVDGVVNPTANITGAAYTNSFSGATSTTLYSIDVVNRNLYIQNPPNAGTLSLVGGGFALASTTDDGGFDISPDNSVALASYNYNGLAGLMQVDLTTGLTADLGNLSMPLVGLAIPPIPVAYSIQTGTNNLMILNLQASVTPIQKAITGLQAGETLLGIDMRPATGQLYGLGSTSRLYRIDMGSGVATSVGPVFSTMLNGTSFGFDFNPTVDRVRVVSNTGQNLRLNPDNAAVAAVDVNLNPGSPAVSSAAYTNNFAGAGSTVLYVIDHATGKLYMQNPPNNGTLVEVGSLGVVVNAENGFDIGGLSGKAFALFNTGSSNKIYTVNLTTGTATEFATVPSMSKGFCVGLGM